MRALDKLDFHHHNVHYHGNALENYPCSLPRAGLETAEGKRRMRKALERSVVLCKRCHLRMGALRKQGVALPFPTEPVSFESHGFESLQTCRRCGPCVCKYCR